MSMDQAVAVAARLRTLLAEEVRRAQEERGLLRRLDTAGLFGRAAERAAFVAEARSLEGELARHLTRVGAELGLPEVTFDALRAAAPREGGQLADVLAEVRALAGALSELDRLNHALAGRALACVRGYVEALAPAPRAYDRRGTRALAASPALAVVSSKG